jgi:hypothetical protein
MTSASGFSKARVIAAAQSVKQQIIIIRNELRICERPKMICVRTGQNGPELAVTTRRQKIGDSLLQVIENHTTIENSHHNARKGVEKYHVSGFDGDI